MEEIFAAKSRQNICRIFAANNDFPYGKIPAGKIGGGAGGGTVRLWSAVPSPGHKKTKNLI